MHNQRLNCLSLVVLGTFGLGFLGTTKIGEAQLDIEQDIMPMSYNCLIS